MASFCLLCFPPAIFILHVPSVLGVRPEKSRVISLGCDPIVVEAITGDIYQRPLVLHGFDRNHRSGIVAFVLIFVDMEAGAAYAAEGAFIVHLVAVAGNADGADHLAMLIKDKLGATFKEDRPV